MEPEPLVPALATGVGEAHHHDVLASIRNAAKLVGALAGSMSIALVVRLLIPRYLGPASFGAINFADAFTTAFFVVLNLGVDTYILKEIPVRPAHASEFLGSVLLLRLIIAALVFAGMALVMDRMHRPAEVRTWVYVFGAGRFLEICNKSFASLLQATASIDGLSITNVTGKAIWAAIVLAALFLGASPLYIPAAFLVSELLKSGALFALAKKHLHFELRFNFSATKLMIWASLPLYLNAVSHTIYGTLDVSVLAGMASNVQVGWYGAAATLANLTLVVSPVLSWVLFPLFARARKRSAEEYTVVIRRSLELILIIAIPTSLAMAVGADVWISLIFGKAYLPGALPLRILAPVFVLTYVSMVSAMALTVNNRAWTLTIISLCGLAFNPVLNVILIRAGLRLFGPAGGGGGAALAQCSTELAVCAAMTAMLGNRPVDRRTVTMLLKTLAVCAVVIGVDRWLKPLGPARLAVDAAVYCILVVAVRAVRLRESWDFARAAWANRRPAVA